MYNILTAAAAAAAAVTNHNPIRVEKVVCIRFWCNFFSSGRARRGRRGCSARDVSQQSKTPFGNIR